MSVWAFAATAAEAAEMGRRDAEDHMRWLEVKLREEKRRQNRMIATYYGGARGGGKTMKQEEEEKPKSRREELQEVIDKAKMEALVLDLEARVRERRRENARGGRWLKADETLIDIKSMEDGHLANTINLYMRRRAPFNGEDADELAGPLIAEAKSRLAQGG